MRALCRAAGGAVECEVPGSKTTRSWIVFFIVFFIERKSLLQLVEHMGCFCQWRGGFPPCKDLMLVLLPVVSSFHGLGHQVITWLVVLESDFNSPASLLLFTSDFRYVSSVLSDQIRGLVLFLTALNAGCFAHTKNYTG